MFSNVLVGVDGHQGGRDAITLANQLAAPAARFTLAHVYGTGLMPGAAAALLLAGELELSAKLLAREGAAAQADAELIAWIANSVGRGLHELAATKRCDLLVVGSCRHGAVGRVFHGHDTVDSLNGARCAIAIAPPGHASAPRSLATVGVGYDGSAESETAVRAARDLANTAGSKLKALCVVSLPTVSSMQSAGASWADVAWEKLNHELRRVGLEDVELEVTYGDVNETLARFGERLDLLVVGSRGYGPVGRLFNGSTSNYLVRASRSPLLVLPRSAGRAGAEKLSEPGRGRATARTGDR